MSGVFAGDLKNLMLSNAVNNTVDARPFNSPLNIEAKGFSYYGQLDGKVCFFCDQLFDFGIIRPEIRS